jgi:hypothetical protein
MKLGMPATSRLGAYAMPAEAPLEKTRVTQCNTTRSTDLDEVPSALHAQYPQDEQVLADLGRAASRSQFAEVKETCMPGKHQVHHPKGSRSPENGSLNACSQV